MLYGPNNMICCCPVHHVPAHREIASRHFFSACLTYMSWPLAHYRVVISCYVIKQLGCISVFKWRRCEYSGVSIWSIDVVVICTFRIIYQTTKTKSLGWTRDIHTSARLILDGCWEQRRLEETDQHSTLSLSGICLLYVLAIIFFGLQNSVRVLVAFSFYAFCPCNTSLPFHLLLLTPFHFVSFWNSWHPPVLPPARWM